MPREFPRSGLLQSEDASDDFDLQLRWMEHFPRERGKDSSYNRLRSHNETGGMFYGLKGESGRLARLVGRFGSYGHDVS